MATCYPLRPCQHPGCNRYAEPGKRFCREHAEQHERERKAIAAEHDRTRGSASQRGYTSTWRRVATAFLDVHPWCIECLRKGIHTPATDVDHIKAWKGSKRLFWDENNWQPLCHECHARKTALEDGRWGNRKK